MSVWKVNALVANVKDLGVFELLQDGLYKFQIIDKEDGETNETKLPKVSLRLQALEGPQEGTMLHTVVLFPETDDKGNPNRMYGALLHFLKAIGIWDGADDAEVEFDTDEFVGREFYANVTTREYDKKDGSGKGLSNKITSIPIAEDGQAPAASEPAPVEEPAVEPEPEPELPKKVAAKPAPAKSVARVAAKPMNNGHKLNGKVPAKEVAKAPVKPLVKRKF